VPVCACVSKPNRTHGRWGLGSTAPGPPFGLHATAAARPWVRETCTPRICQPRLPLPLPSYTPVGHGRPRALHLRTAPSQAAAARTGAPPVPLATVCQRPALRRDPLARRGAERAVQSSACERARQSSAHSHCDDGALQGQHAATAPGGAARVRPPLPKPPAAHALQPALPAANTRLHT
jgi:hypothetical protein